MRIFLANYAQKFGQFCAPIHEIMRLILNIFYKLCAIIVILSCFVVPSMARSSLPWLNVYNFTVLRIEIMQKSVKNWKLCEKFQKYKICREIENYASQILRIMRVRLIAYFQHLYKLVVLRFNAARSSPYLLVLWLILVLVWQKIQEPLSGSLNFCQTKVPVMTDQY